MKLNYQNGAGIKASICYIFLLLSIFNFSLAESVTEENPPTNITLTALSKTPTVDGELTEWGSDKWHPIILKPAQEKHEKKLPAELLVELKIAILDGMFYMAAKWPDSKPDLEYKNWVWRANKYRRGKKLDDMFAIRFDMEGDYNQCMISGSSYNVDVWLWSSARSNLTDYAEDMYHRISTRYIENAAEYENKQGKTVYIKKKKDAGIASYAYKRINRKKKQKDKLSSVKVIENPSGSVIDVKAKAKWKNGKWYIEMARKLDTGNEDDVLLKDKKNIRASIAVFNHNASENKNKSNTLLIQLNPL